MIIIPILIKISSNLKKKQTKRTKNYKINVKKRYRLP